MEPRDAAPAHVPVLLAETVSLLEPRPGDVVVDCTAGAGGHAAALAEAAGPGTLVVGFDLDPDALAVAADRVRSAGARFEPVRASFRHAPARIAGMDLRAAVVLADLGFSTTQMQDPARGFSFLADGPLDMRYDPEAEITAARVIADATERELADLIFRYGEEPYARRIARRIAETRRRAPIRTTSQLADLVREAYGARARRSRLHPATRTFMALRIAVNDELAALDTLLEGIADGAERAGEGGWLAPGARVAIISFHSLEDRRVKRAFAGLDRAGLAERLTRRPLTATPREVAANPRARGAKLRAIRLSSRPALQKNAGEVRRGP